MKILAIMSSGQIKGNTGQIVEMLEAQLQRSLVATEKTWNLKLSIYIA